jgi:hypothetical protein
MDANGKPSVWSLESVAAGMMFVRTGSQEDVAGIFAIDVDFSSLTAANLLFSATAHKHRPCLQNSDYFKKKRNTVLIWIKARSRLALLPTARIPYEAFVSFL